MLGRHKGQRASPQPLQLGSQYLLYCCCYCTVQFLLLELEEGLDGVPRYGLVLPLIDGDFRGTLRPTR
jgi:hypothetical protein